MTFPLSLSLSRLRAAASGRAAALPPNLLSRPAGPTRPNRPNHPGRPRRLTGAILAALAATALVQAPPAAAASADEPLTVLFGTSGALSGPQTPIGADGANGVRLAVDDLNAQGLRIGGRRVVWKVDSQDDQADPKQAATVAQHFADEHVNGVVGHMNSGTSFPASRIYARAGIPQITGASTDPKLARQGFPTFFRAIATDDAVGAALAGFAQTSLHARRIAIIDDRTAYGQGLADSFVHQARSRGMTIVAREYTNDRATDFSAILTRIKATAPDAIVYGGVFHQAGPMLAQIARFGIKTHFLGGDAICLPALAQLAGPAVNITYCAEGGQPIDRMPGGLAWKKRYDAAFGPRAFQVYSPYTYDATMILARAMIKAGSADPAKYLPMIRDIDYDGVSRSHIHFDRDGNLAEPLVMVSHFEGGVKRTVSVESVR